MKFSFFMMPLHHPKENPSLAFQRDISLIHLADELDFDEFCKLMAMQVLTTQYSLSLTIHLYTYYPLLSMRPLLTLSL